MHLSVRSKYKSLSALAEGKHYHLQMTGGLTSCSLLYSTSYQLPRTLKFVLGSLSVHQLVVSQNGGNLSFPGGLIHTQIKQWRFKLVMLNKLIFSSHVSMGKPNNAYIIQKGNGRLCCLKQATRNIWIPSKKGI